MRILTIIFISTASLLCAAPNMNSTIEMEIRKNWDLFEAAWEREDARGCASQFTLDGVNIPPQYTINIGRASIEKFYGRLFANHLWSDYEHTIDKLDVYSDNQVVEIGHFKVDWMRNDSTTWTFNARSLSTWVKSTDGRWYIDKFVYNNPVDQEDISELETKWKTAEKEQKILEQDLLLAKGQLQRNYLLAGLIGMILLSTIIYNRHQYKQRLAANEIDTLKQEKTIIALDNMVQGQENERTRIASDLHDGLGGLLTSAQMQMQKIAAQLQDDGKISAMNDASAIVNQAQKEVRRISHDMMPGALTDLGFIDALEDLTNIYGKSGKYAIEFKNSSNDDQLNQHQKIQLYRIAQEILHNADKHAEPTRIEIQCASDASRYILTISDNGKGLPADQIEKNEGIGLQNIRSRVRYLDGNINLETSKDWGTRFIIEIPLS